MAPDIATAVGFGGRPNAERPKLRLVSWQPLRKGALRGFATIELPVGLKINDCPVFVTTKSSWANLPGRPVIDGERRHKLGADGKPAYVAVGEWRNRQLAEGFSAAVIAAVRQAHPADLD